MRHQHCVKWCVRNVPCECPERIKTATKTYWQQKPKSYPPWFAKNIYTRRVTAIELTVIPTGLRPNRKATTSGQTAKNSSHLWLNLLKYDKNQQNSHQRSFVICINRWTGLLKTSTTRNLSGVSNASDAVQILLVQHPRKHYPGDFWFFCIVPTKKINRP